MSEDPKGGGNAGAPEEPGNSVLRFLEQKVGEAPHVNLRDEDSATVSAPVIDPSSMEKLSVPQGRGNYQLMGEIARGGMGVVLKGHDTDLGRDIAVKVLDKRLCERMDVVQRFVEEAQIGGQLQHPGIVPVYELGLMEDERPYFTMKLVKGRTLAALIAQRETAADNRGRLVDIFESICQTMAYAHSRGVIHRDLKPANIMVGAFGEVQVVDWGLAKVLVRGGTADEERSRESQPARTILETVRSDGTSGSSHSLVGSVLGTPAYMPPEQAAGRVHKLDERSDVFALGAILCEILTGAPPYVGTTQEILEAAAQAELDDALERLDACGADPVLIKSAKQCLMAAPAARPADAGVLAERVHAYVVSSEERAHRAEVEATEARVRAEEDRKARRLTLALGAAVVAIVLVGSGGWLWVQNERSTQQAIEAERREELAERDRLLREEVNAALNDAAVFQGAESWDEAIVAAERARALAEGGEAGAELIASVDATLAALNEGLAGAERREEFRRDTQRLVAELREVARPDEQLEDEDKDRQFRETFLAHGIDLDGVKLEGAAEQLTRRGLGSEVALALDAWGEVRRLREDEDGALRLLELAHRIDPDPDRAHLREAMAVRDLEELRYLAEEGFEGQPASTWALLGASLARLEDRDLALEVFRTGLGLHPEDFELHYLLAAQLTPGVEDSKTHAELREAEALWRAALALDHTAAGAHFALGWVYRGLQDPERELRQFDLAYELDPTLNECWFRRAQALGRLGRLEEARASYEKGTELEEPAWVEGWSRASLARYVALDGDHERALQMSRDTWDSGLSSGFFLRIWLLQGFGVVAGLTGDEAPLVEARQLVDEYFAGSGDAGVRDLTRAYERYSGLLLQLAVHRGQLHSPPPITDEGRRVLLAHCIEVARDGTELGQDNIGLWRHLGQASYFAGDAETAVAALTREDELDDEDDVVNGFALALALHARGDETQARSRYLQALTWMAKDPESPAPVRQWWREQCAEALGPE